MKTHWYTSPDPPRFGEDLVALCGQVVPKAQPVMAMWDADEDHGPGYGLVKCRDCDAHSAQWVLTTKPERYLAVIQSGEESISR